MMTKEPFEFFSPPLIFSIAEMKAVHSSIVFAWVHSFDSQLKWQNAESLAQALPRKKIAGALRVL